MLLPNPSIGSVEIGRRRSVDACVEGVRAAGPKVIPTWVWYLLGYLDVTFVAQFYTRRIVHALYDHWNPWRWPHRSKSWKPPLSGGLEGVFYLSLLLYLKREQAATLIVAWVGIKVADLWRLGIGQRSPGVLSQAGIEMQRTFLFGSTLSAVNAAAAAAFVELSLKGRLLESGVLILGTTTAAMFLWSWLRVIKVEGRPLSKWDGHRHCGRLGLGDALSLSGLGLVFFALFLAGWKPGLPLALLLPPTTAVATRILAPCR